MLEFETQSAPATVTDLIPVTRENGRSIEHYRDIIAQCNLPQLVATDGASILDIGTGLGNALPGLIAMTANRGVVVSFDINTATLNEAYTRLQQRFAAGAVVDRGQSDAPTGGGTEIAVERPQGQLPRLRPGTIALVEGDISKTFKLPERVFDIAISVWVFYQICDKLAAVRNVLQSLRGGGRFWATSTGSIAVTPGPIRSDCLDWLKERVWNTRASRFSWLAGTRELEYWAREARLDIAIVSLEAFLSLTRTDLSVCPGRTDPGRPEGAFMVEVRQELSERPSANFNLPMLSYVTTRYSSIVPIYESETVYSLIKKCG